MAGLFEGDAVEGVGGEEGAGGGEDQRNSSGILGTDGFVGLSYWGLFFYPRRRLYG